MAKLQIEFQVTKSGIPLEISDHLSSLLSSKSDQIPPAYMCNHEKLVFILYDKLDKKLREYLGEMGTEKTANIAYISTFGDNIDEVCEISHNLGVEVAGTLNLGVKKSLFGKGKLTDADVQKAVDFARETAQKLFTSLKF